MDSLSISSSQNEFDQDNDNCDLTYDKLDYDDRQQQQQPSQLHSSVQDNREVCLNCQYIFLMSLKYKIMPSINVHVILFIQNNYNFTKMFLH